MIVNNLLSEFECSSARVLGKLMNINIFAVLLLDVFAFRWPDHR